MTETEIQELIKDRGKLNSETLPELRELVNRYPFFQTVRLLYIENLFVLHHKDFGKELRKASVFVPDRKALFLMTEGVHYDLEKSQRKDTVNIETENESDRTISLIDNFLSSQVTEEATDGTNRSKPSIADVTTDYASFLLQQDDDKTETDNPNTPKLRGSELIESFIKETKGKQRIEITELPTDENGDYFTSPLISDEDEEIYTENMVNIYIKQERYQQALEILKKICLNNPKKNANFASQIKLLEVITGN